MVPSAKVIELTVTVFPVPTFLLLNVDEFVLVTVSDPINPDKDRVVVQGVNVIKRHRKATQESPGKIEEIEASIHISNVSHVDPGNGKPTRVKYEIKDGVKKRMSVVSGSLLDK